MENIIFLWKKAPGSQDKDMNNLWTIYYDGNGYAKYKITLFANQYLKITGPMYSVWIENRDGMCIIGHTGNQSHVDYPDGPQDWEDYFGKVRSLLGWGTDIKSGLSDADSRVEEIVKDPKIKKLLDDYLQKYKYVILHDIFERFR